MTKKINYLPPHVYKEFGSYRNFLRTRKKQVREALKLINKIRFGCAFFPDNGQDFLKSCESEFEKLYKILKENC